MRRYNLIQLLIFGFALIFAGCVVRTYPVTKERADQDLNIGNRGYLKGGVPSQEARERKTTRTTQMVEVELHSPIRFEKMPKPKSQEKTPVQEIEDKETWGNRGYITQSIEPEVITGPSFEKYTVQKNDTLQKISKKIYGTTKKWTKIYEANRGILRGPDKIYPGQVINIPIESLKETQENLK